MQLDLNQIRLDGGTQPRAELLLEVIEDYAEQMASHQGRLESFIRSLTGDSDAARDILVTMGVYFQAQDDYLDCYGTPEQIGKVGTDIADKKCGWLFTKAYHQLANPQQKAFLDQHYGKCKVGSPEERKIKELYTDLGLKHLYAEYEQASYDKIMSMKNSEQGAILASAGVPWEVFEMFLQKVYKRSK